MMGISGKVIEEERLKSEEWVKNAPKEELLEFQKKFDPRAALRREPQDKRRSNGGKRRRRFKSAAA